MRGAAPADARWRMCAAFGIWKLLMFCVGMFFLWATHTRDTHAARHFARPRAEGTSTTGTEPWRCEVCGVYKCISIYAMAVWSV